MKTKIKPRGSVLVYSLIIMFVILSITLGITKVVITQQKTSSDTSKSVQAMQIANSGIEKVLNKRNNSENTDAIKDLADNPNDCEDGIIKYNIGEGTATISFFDQNDSSLNNCDEPVSNIRSIKSVGEINKTKRAIKVDIE